MTEFEIGQRVYWKRTMSGPRHVLLAVEGGVIVTTSPAISTIWVDDGPDGEQPRMVTVASDRIPTCTLDDLIVEVDAHNTEIKDKATAADKRAAQYWDEVKAREAKAAEEPAAKQYVHPVDTGPAPFPFSLVFGRRK